MLGRGERLERIKNKAAIFAAKNFLVTFEEKFLNDVGENAHAAAAALIVADLGESDAVVAFGDAGIQHQNIFRDGGSGAGSFGGERFQFFFLAQHKSFDLFALGVDDFFVFLEFGFGGFHAALGFLSGHHNFQLAIFDPVLGAGRDANASGNTILKGIEAQMQAAFSALSFNLGTSYVGSRLGQFSAIDSRS